MAAFGCVPTDAKKAVQEAKGDRGANVNGQSSDIFKMYKKNLQSVVAMPTTMTFGLVDFHWCFMLSHGCH